ncbi:MAG: hypothetical protein QOG19_1347, partial [Mycobacterium sp.]|nr:hypothetical protein [Mycobacterium sp.]
MPFPAIYPAMPALLRSSAARYGPAAFLIVDGQTLTYAGLERRSARLAASLLAEGI